MGKYKNTILYAITYFAVFVLLAGICLIDSDSLIPHLMIIISGAWCLLFYWVNEEALL